MLFLLRNINIRHFRLVIILGGFGLIAACGGGGGGGGGSSSPSASNASPASLNSAAINLVLNANRTVGVAPLAVSFDTVGTTSTGSSLPFHEIKYIWDFGDPAGGAVWRYGTRANSASKASRNAAYGSVAAHVFESPGNYLVKVTGFDGDISVEKQILITVTDPNSFFNAKTICISSAVMPTAGGDGCPVGAAVQVVTNWATIGALSSTYKRILLKRGDAWSASSRANISSGPGVIGAFGSASDKPKINITSNTNGLYFSGVSDWRVMDLEIFSSESSSGVSDNNERIPLRSFNSKNITVIRCNFHDAYLTLMPELSDDFSVIDSEMSSTFPNYGNMVAFFYKGARVAILGNKFSTSYTTHTLRISGTNNAIISNNHMDNPGATRDALTIRGWEGPTPYTQYVIVSDNVIDGGAAAGYLLYIGVVNNATNEELRDVVVERNFIKSTSNATPNVFKVAQNLTFRNNVTISYSEMSLAINGGGNTAGAPDPRSSFVYNNSFYKANASLNNRYSAIQINGAVTGVRLVNNLAFAPGSVMSAGWVNGGGTFLYTSAGASVGASVDVLKNNSTDNQIVNVNPWAVGVLTAPDHFVPSGYAITDGFVNGLVDDYFLTSRPVDSKVMGALAN